MISNAEKFAKYGEAESLWGTPPEPSAELLRGVGQLEKLMVHELNHGDDALSTMLVPVMRARRHFTEKDGSAIEKGLEEEALLARLPHDKKGWGLAAFRYDPNRPLDDIIANLRKELEELRSFPPNPPRPRGKDWATRMIDLLCYRAKQRNIGDWKMIAPLIDPCIKAAGCGGMLTHKSWLNRVRRAFDEIFQREGWLAERQREMLPHLPQEHHAFVMRRPYESKTIPWKAAPQVWGDLGMSKFILNAKK